jgi:beta-aspartyl-peptidase (threonine type)
VQWALALHGGAGTLDKTDDPIMIAKYEAALRAALEKGTSVLASGGSSLDACEAVVRELEDNELFNAGKGAALNIEGVAELDAAFMDGSTTHYGTVTGVTTVRNPVSLARIVMQQRKFGMLAGAGAEAFANEQTSNPQIKRVPNAWFVTPRRRQMLDDVLVERGILKRATQRSTATLDHAARMGTVGCVALDSKGNLAAATSTGGLTGKLVGRVGDAPIIGAGTLATSDVAISCTGSGEQFIRFSVARAVSERMQLLHESVHDAAKHVIFSTLAKDDGGLIALDARGEIALPYNTVGMYRGFAKKFADGTSQSGVGIFEEVK